MVKWVPSLMTLTNLVLGLFALMACLNGDYARAALLVVIGMIVDGLDGRVARALGVQSDFGKELDSLSDMVTFGVAPAVIIYYTTLRNMGPTGMAIAISFTVAGALRLARYNLQTGGVHYFVGLPITAAGGILATLALYHGLIPIGWIPVLTLTLSLLMVSRTRYPNFKKIGFPKAAGVGAPLFAIGVAIIFAVSKLLLMMMIIAVIAFYGVYGVWYQWRRYLHRRVREREEWRRSP